MCFKQQHSQCLCTWKGLSREDKLRDLTLTFHLFEAGQRLLEEQTRGYASCTRCQ